MSVTTEVTILARFWLGGTAETPGEEVDARMVTIRGEDGHALVARFAVTRDGFPACDQFGDAIDPATATAAVVAAADVAGFTLLDAFAEVV